MRKGDKNALPWNDSGFGSNDPGHNREAQEPARFYQDYPVDIDRPLDVSLFAEERVEVKEALVRLKEHLPYTLRFETDIGTNGKAARHTIGHSDQRGVYVELPAETVTLRTALQLILNALPAGWRGTVFPDRVILYKETAQWRYALEYLVRRP